MGEFVRLSRPEPTTSTPNEDVDIERIESEGVRLNNVEEAIKRLNLDGVPVFGHAIGVRNAYSTFGLHSQVSSYDNYVHHKHHNIFLDV